MRDWLVSVSVLPDRRTVLPVRSESSFGALQEVMRREMVVAAMQRAGDRGVVISVFKANGKEGGR